MATRGSKIALAGTSLFAVSTVIFVHFQQKAEKEVRQLSVHEASHRFFSSLERLSVLTCPVYLNQAMHQGVIRDMEQQRIKRERQLDFDLQRQLEAEYRQEQNVRSTTADDANTAGATKR